MPLKFNRGLLIDDTFFLSVMAKGIGGLVEFLVGIALIFISVEQLHHLLEPLARLGFHAATEISGSTQLFAAFYLSIRGFVRAVLAVCLLKEQLWAYPAAMAVIVAAIGYQALLLTTGHFSWGLLSLTVFDAFIVYLTYYEYQKLKRGGHLSGPHL